MQCTTRTLKKVRKLSVERWTLNTLNEQHISEMVEAMLQTSQLLKWRQGITAKGFLAPPTRRL